MCAHIITIIIGTNLLTIVIIFIIISVVTSRLLPPFI